MARVDAFEITVDPKGGATFDLYHQEGEVRERLTEQRIREAPVASLWLEMLRGDGDLEWDEAWESLKLTEVRKYAPKAKPAVAAPPPPPAPEPAKP